MPRILLLLVWCFLSCQRQKIKETSKSSHQNSKVDSTSDVRFNTPEDFRFNRERLDTMFLVNRDSSRYSYQDYWITLFIGRLFTNHYRYAVLRYLDNDSVSSVIVLRKVEKRWDTVLFTQIPSMLNVVADEIVDVSDYNGDNIPDLRVIKEYFHFGHCVSADLWVFNKGHFSKVEGFDGVVSPVYDKKTDLLYAYQSNGCADMDMYFGVFKIIGNKLHKIKEMNCDCCETHHDSCVIEGFGGKPYLVPYKKAYKYVPQFFADGVKWKCGLK